MLNLDGRVALVTGGARGIGEAISTKLAEYGATVAVSDARPGASKAVADKLAAEGRPSGAYDLDVTRWDAAQRVADQVEADLGPIDILVNNAGLSGVVPFLKMDEAEWNRIISTNLTGMFVVCRAVVPKMVERRQGRIVNMSSILGKLGEGNFTHYAASKFGVIGFSQALAEEVAPFDVTVNCVCPGIVDTPMWTDLYRDALDTLDDYKTEAELRELILSRIPLRRTQPPEDIAEMVAYLSSDLARNMTGGSYHVDGGMRPR